MDGEITFHDWHPANIQEYGIAAPDPRDPDMVYGSARNERLALHRKTGQTTNVGPSADQRASGFGRNVRTMPIAWSPLNPDVLYYTSNVVWKSTDRARTWTRVSPDLARQTWEVPANAGKYANTVTPAPLGSITALSLSPRSAGVIWAGTDDGNIQVTMDGGAKWSNVTPPEIKPWTRIFNIEAGHFDNQTAYAAANTLRLDDLNPHFWRTHDGGRRGRRSTPASRRAQWRTPFARTLGSVDCSTRRRICRYGFRSTMAITGSRSSSTCRRSPCVTSR
jgi:hypothetical protein